MSLIVPLNNLHSLKYLTLTYIFYQICWVVEAANARIKHWKYLAHVLPTNQVPFIGDYVRRVCAISNRFLRPLSVGDSDTDEALAAKMIHLSLQNNLLQIYIEENALDKRSSNWEQVSPGN